MSAAAYEDLGVSPIFFGRFVVGIGHLTKSHLLV